jgi:hypothetical protein
VLERPEPGIRCYLPKPVTSDALLGCVDEALERADA